MALRRILEYWWVGPLLALLLAGVFGYRMLSAEKTSFLPGLTSSGHHQMEASCADCHTPFEGVKQEACLDCHGEALDSEMDSHAPSIFNDPRSFSMLKIIDAGKCITCHGEHLAERNQDKIANAPEDFCFPCHQDIAQERPSHKDFKREGCAASGCHNYHDNQALYEEFIAQHLNEARLKPGQPTVMALSSTSVGVSQATDSEKALTINDQDGPDLNTDQHIMQEWAASSHARAGINCSDCHQPTDPATDVKEPWNDQPSLSICKDCHGFEAKGFEQGKHGMRLAADLSPMSPALARQPMKADAHDKLLTCNTCHSAHRYDTGAAAAESCLNCHDDIHSKAYPGSPHDRLWQAELTQMAPKGTGVSCATCHMPWTTVKKNGVERPAVMHNQNANLRPNTKMIRTVCLDCHGLGYTLNALADTDLLLNNYFGDPKERVDSLEMVRIRGLEKKKAATEAVTVP